MFWTVTSPRASKVRVDSAGNNQGSNPRINMFTGYTMGGGYLEYVLNMVQLIEPKQPTEIRVGTK